MNHTQNKRASNHLQNTRRRNGKGGNLLLKGIVAATGLVCFLLFAGIMSGRPKTPVLPAGSGSPTLQTDLSGTIAEIGKQIIVEQTAATPEEAEKLLQNAAEEDDENEQGENIEALVEEFRHGPHAAVPRRAAAE